MGILINKNLRILDSENDFYYKFGREGFDKINNEEAGDSDFDTYRIVSSKDTIIYTMILPVQVEENLASVVTSFVKEKVPNDSEFKIDFSYVKDKGKLKVLISVINKSKYEEIRNKSYQLTDKLSGIIPIQALYYTFAFLKGVKDGLCVFTEGENAVCFYMEKGFPLNFVRTRINDKFQFFLNRMVSSLRKDYEKSDKHLFGIIDGDEGKFDQFKKYNIEFSIPETIIQFEKNKLIPKLNILPLKERKVNRKIWKYLFMTAGVIIAAFYIYQFAGDYTKLKKEVEKYEIKLKKERIAAMQLSKIMDEKDNLQEELNFLLKYEKQKKKVLLALTEITRLAPDDTYATSIRINDRNNEIEFTGKSKNVYGLQRSLSKSKYLKDLKKPGTVRKDKGGYDTFVMRGKIVY